MSKDKQMMKTKLAAASSVLAVNELMRRHQGDERLAEALNELAHDILSPTVGAMMPIPMSVQGMCVSGPDEAMHVLLYARVQPGSAKMVMEGFNASVKPFLVDAPLGGPQVVQG